MASSRFITLKITTVQAATSSAGLSVIRRCSPTESKSPAALTSDLKCFRCALSNPINRLHSDGEALLDSTRRNTWFIRSVSRRVELSTRSASIRDASVYVGSFRRTSACNGVFVAGRRTIQNSRSGASNVCRDGGGTVRFQNVYIERRYSFSP